MLFLIEELSGNVARFARYCVETLTLEDAIILVTKGIDIDACNQWNISADEWQDAIFATLEELRKNR